jgi:IS1 family transposase
MQIIGLQADETWSFVKKKTKKRWIWVVYDPEHRLVVAPYVGCRGIKSAKKLWKRIPFQLRRCEFETDDWKA